MVRVPIKLDELVQSAFINTAASGNEVGYSDVVVDRPTPATMRTNSRIQGAADEGETEYGAADKDTTEDCDADELANSSFDGSAEEEMIKAIPSSSAEVPAVSSKHADDERGDSDAVAELLDFEKQLTDRRDLLLAMGWRWLKAYCKGAVSSSDMQKGCNLLRESMHNVLWLLCKVRVKRVKFRFKNLKRRFKRLKCRWCSAVATALRSVRGATSTPNSEFGCVF